MRRSRTCSRPERKGRPVSVRSAHRRLANELRMRMACGDLKANDILPSMRELARTYKTTFDTIRLALDVLKSEGRIAGTPRRRLAILPQAKHFPEMSPRGIVLLVHTAPLNRCMENPALRQIQMGIEQGAGESALPITIVHDEFFRTSVPHDYLNWPLSGILVCGIATPKAIGEYAQLATPTVLVDLPPEGAKVGAVCVDNAGCAKDMTRRVLALGHRRVAFLRRFSFTRQRIDPDSVERESGFRQACSELRHKVSPHDIFTVFHTETPMSASIQTVAGAQSKFTAAICADSTIAQLVLSAARNAGKQIPREFSIVCFQARAGKPSFTGYASDFRELGLHAVYLLRSRPFKPTVHRISSIWVEGGTLASPNGNQSGGTSS